MEVPDKIEIHDGRSVTLTWQSGRTQSIDAPSLRAACMCASCRDEAGARATAAVLEHPERIRILDAALVGAYAINFGFAPDNHHTGIYSFDSLRALPAGRPED